MSKLILYKITSTEEESQQGYQNFLNANHNENDVARLYHEQETQCEDTYKNFLIEKLEFEEIAEFINFLNKRYLERQSEHIYMSSEKEVDKNEAVQ